MRRMKHLLLIVPLVLALAPAFAQEVTPEVEPPLVVEGADTVIVEAEQPPNVPGEDEAMSLAETLIAAVLASAFGTAPITMFIVQLLKRPLPGVSARTLTAIVALLLSALTAAAVWFGVETQWNSLLDAIATAGPSIVTLIGTLIGAPIYFELAKRSNAPGLSYARSPRDSPATARW